MLEATVEHPPQGRDGGNGFAKALGARLRAVRKRQHLSLRGVQKKSAGRWKAVVVGSYERGSRAVSAQRLCELAEFYAVPVSDLLPGREVAFTGRCTEPMPPPITFNLDRIADLADPNADTLKRFVVSIQCQRGAVGDRALGVRQEDIRALALMYDCTMAAMTKRLVNWQVLSETPAIAAGSA